ncbi:MAG: TolC family protein, partial [Bradymonadaceae bacterium]
MAGLCVWTWVGEAHGEETEGDLTVDRAIELSIERTAFRKTQAAQIEALQGERRAAKSWPNPTLAYEREQEWEAEGVLAEDFFILEQALPIWGTRALRAEAVRAQMEAAESANAAERQDRELEVERAFYRTLRERRQLELARQLREQVAATVEVMKKRLEADEASQYSVA